jgi:hypothetical protein
VANVEEFVNCYTDSLTEVLRMYTKNNKLMPEFLEFGLDKTRSFHVHTNVSVYVDDLKGIAGLVLFLCEQRLGIKLKDVLDMNPYPSHDGMAQLRIPCSNKYDEEPDERFDICEERYKAVYKIKAVPADYKDYKTMSELA